MAKTRSELARLDRRREEAWPRRRVGEAVFPDDAGPFICGDCGEPHYAWHTVTHEDSGVQYAVAFCTKG